MPRPFYFITLMLTVIVCLSFKDKAKVHSDLLTIHHSPFTADTLLFPDEKHFKNVQQLTFGGDNAEAYWSFDGKYIIFQYTGGDVKADQMFTMNPDGSNKKMVS